MAGDSTSSSPLKESLPFSTLIHMLTIKLSATNYLLWEDQVTSLLSCQGLLGYVDGTLAVPPEKVTVDEKIVSNPAYVDWCFQDQRLRSLLLSSLTEEAHAETLGCKTSRTMWLALEEAYSPTSEDRAMSLREELQALKKGDKSVNEFGREFKSFCDKLAAMNSPVSEFEKSHWFLRGLGSSFANFSTAQMAVRPLPTFKELVSRAVSHNIFQNALDVSQPQPVAAFYAQKSRANQQYGGRNSNSGGAYSMNSNQNHSGNPNRGNQQYGGRRNYPGNNRGKGKSYTPKCQICGEFGHSAEKCNDRYTRSNNNEAQLAEAFHARCQLEPNKSDWWYADTGASAHMTPNTESLDSTAPYTGNDHVLVGNGTALDISHIGTCDFSKSVKLSNVLVVPELTKNLVSISRLTRDFPVNVTFTDNSFVIQTRGTGEILAKGKRDQGLYVLEKTHSKLIHALYSKKLSGSFNLWHSRLGHVCFDTIKLLNKLGYLSVNSILPNPTVCSPCQLAKSKRLPFEKNEKRANAVLNLVHCDLWGPAPVPSTSGFRYYAIFIDDFSRYTWLFPLRQKSDFGNIFEQYQLFVENQFGCKIKVFQSDGGTEFTNRKLQSHFRNCGIHHIMSCPNTPSQNGRAERKHRHITETGLSMLFNSHAPSSFWLDAFSAAVYTINRLPTMVLDNKSPFEELFGQIPDYANFHPFGCRVYPYLRDYSANKLAPRSIPCIFMGYSSQHKGFRCLDSAISRVYISRHAKFDESCFPFARNQTTISPASLEFSAYTDAGPVPRLSAPSSIPETEPQPSSTTTCTEPCSICIEPDSSRSKQDPSQPATPTNNASTAIEPTSSEINIENPPTNKNESARHHMTTRARAGIFKPKHRVDLTFVSSGLLSALFASKEPKGFKSAAKNPE